MNLDEQFLEKTDKIRLIKLENENVIRFPDQNTLNTKVKQIRNPQREISGGFFYLLYCEKYLFITVSAASTFWVSFPSALLVPSYSTLKIFPGKTIC